MINIGLLKQAYITLTACTKWNGMECIKNNNTSAIYFRMFFRSQLGLRDALSHDSSPYTAEINLY